MLFNAFHGFLKAWKWALGLRGAAALAGENARGALGSAGIFPVPTTSQDSRSAKKLQDR